MIRRSTHRGVFAALPALFLASACGEGFPRELVESAVLLGGRACDVDGACEIEEVLAPGPDERPTYQNELDGARELRCWFDADAGPAPASLSITGIEIESGQEEGSARLRRDSGGAAGGEGLERLQVRRRLRPGLGFFLEFELWGPDVLLVYAYPVTEGVARGTGRRASARYYLSVWSGYADDSLLNPFVAFGACLPADG